MLLIKILLAFIAAYIALISLMIIFQGKLLYHPTKQILDDPLPPFTKIIAKTNDGLELLAWYVAPQQGKPVIFYLHGNGATIAWRLQKLQPFIDQGYGLYLAEYRGYGGNKGKPSEIGLKQDVLAHYQAIPDQQNIIAYGESLGTHLALYIATQQKVSGVILENAYTSITDMAGHHYPIAKPAAKYVRDHYDSMLIAKHVTAPVLQLHASDDKTVPIAYGRKLHAALNSQFVEISGVGHNNIYENPETLKAVLKFLHRI